jgi:hypothetical protein
MDSDSDKTRLIRSNQTNPKPVGSPDNNSPDATRILKSTGVVPPPLPQQANDPDATRILPRSANNPSVTDIPLTGTANGKDDDNTRIIDSSKTKLVRKSSPQNVSGGAGNLGGPGSSMEDPVVGWLVVVDGPGKGSMVCIGEQDNRIGRGGGGDVSRVCLNFGDGGISRGNAFVLRYDPKKRRFKILPGEGANIVYLNDEDLDSPKNLNSRDIIEVSETKLCFIPFCGEEFDWADTEDKDSLEAS